jgi:hypothetical protein
MAAIARLRPDIIFGQTPQNRAVSLHFAHYNFVRLDHSLRTAPAMAAGVSDGLWTLEDLVEQTTR